jgi:hypothetical protein
MEHGFLRVVSPSVRASGQSGMHEGYESERRQTDPQPENRKTGKQGSECNFPASGLLSEPTHLGRA